MHVSFGQRHRHVEDDPADDVVAKAVDQDELAAEAEAEAPEEETPAASDDSEPAPHAPESREEIAKRI